MPTLHQQISATFLAKLAETEGFSQNDIEQLKAAFADPQKLKADSLVKIFSRAEGDELKW